MIIFKTAHYYQWLGSDAASINKFPFKLRYWLLLQSYTNLKISLLHYVYLHVSIWFKATQTAVKPVLIVQPSYHISAVVKITPYVSTPLLLLLTLHTEVIFYNCRIFKEITYPKKGEGGFL